MKVFEVSFEVANKVGGIYTVLSSKAKFAKKSFGDNYFCVGPYFENKARHEFEYLKPGKELSKSLSKLESLGVKVYYGRWLVDGNPLCFLVDFSNCFDLNDLKYDLWKKYFVDSYDSGFDFNEPLAFSYGVSLLLKELFNTGFLKEKDVVHCHEWMTGFAGLILKSWGVDVKSVFTTHATVLGRSISGNNEDLYSNIKSFSGKDIAKAKSLGVLNKHSAEKAMAHNFDVFTTVSDLTGDECYFLLGKKPDFITFNGINLDVFNSSKKYCSLSKKRIDLIVKSLFGFNKNYKSVFFGGRYEFRSKGLGPLVDSLKYLDELVVSKKSKVVVFLLLAMDNFNLKLDVLKRISLVGLESFYKKQEVFLKEAMSFDFSTHYLSDDDILLSKLRSSGVDSLKNVKVVVVPSFLDGFDGIFNLDYLDAISGFDLGVFPSYYEPWGYTPVESLGVDIPCIMTNHSGFGIYSKNNFDYDGFVSFESDNFEEDLGKMMFSFLFNKKKVNFDSLLKSLDWSLVYSNYLDAYGVR